MLFSGTYFLPAVSPWFLTFGDFPADAQLRLPRVAVTIRPWSVRIGRPSLHEAWQQTIMAQNVALLCVSHPLTCLFPAPLRVLVSWCAFHPFACHLGSVFWVPTTHPDGDFDFFFFFEYLLSIQYTNRPPLQIILFISHSSPLRDGYYSHYLKDVRFKVKRG